MQISLVLCIFASFLGCALIWGEIAAMPQKAKYRRKRPAAQPAQPDKRQKTHTGTVPNTVVYGRREGEKKNLEERKAYREEKTPYGTVIQTFNVGSDTHPVDQEFVHPFALLWHLCAASVHFFDFLAEGYRQSAGGSAAAVPSGSATEGAPQPLWRIVLYADEATPGNVHRPDKGRQFMAVYWTFREWPDWFRAGRAGWFPFCFVHHAVLKKISGGLGHLMVLVLRSFFAGSTGSAGPSSMPAGPYDEAWTFQMSGISLCRGPGRPDFLEGAPGEALHLKATFGCFLGDEKAHNAIVGSKGASGTKPCHCCQNVVGHKDAKDLPATHRLVHYTCGDPDRFEPHTADSLQRHLGMLSQAATTGSAGELKKLQQVLGLNFDKDGLLLSDMAGMANQPDSTFWDWMHCIVASGGMGQYELNQFLRRIAKIKPEWLSYIDKIGQDVITWPKCSGYKKLRLADRLRKRDNKPIKLFASEVLQQIVVVGVFAETTLKQEGHLPEERQCFELLGRILYLLRRGDAAVQQVELLRTLVIQHHNLFLKLYPKCGKPKVHYTMHVPDCIARFKVNLSCFSPERLHKFTKHIAAFSFKGLTKCLLSRSVAALVDAVSLPDTTAAFALQPPAQPVTGAWLALLQAAGAAPSQDGKVLRQQLRMERMLQGGMQLTAQPPEGARQLRCPVGTLRANDLLLWHSGGALQAGFAVAFFKAWEGKSFFAGVLLLQPEGDNKYTYMLDKKHLVPAHLIWGSYPYVAKDGVVYVVGSKDLLGRQAH